MTRDTNEEISIDYNSYVIILLTNEEISIDFYNYHETMHLSYFGLFLVHSQDFLLSQALRSPLTRKVARSRVENLRRPQPGIIYVEL